VPRLVDNNSCVDDLPEEQERSLRPRRLSDFTGQRSACENLSVFIGATKMRNEALDHVLLFGPPGLGKTTLAQIIACELGVEFKMTSAPILAKAGDLAAILTNLAPNSVFFIDEIHRLNVAVEETLYSAMEDFKIDILIGEGAGARSVRLDLPRFTLVGATTRSGLLTQPLRERFSIPIRLQFYETADLVKIINRAASILKIEIDGLGSEEIAKRSRGTPRIAVRLLRRVRDFAVMLAQQQSLPQKITLEIANLALEKLEVDCFGLDSQDIRYLRIIAEHYNGGPVGIDTIAAALAEERDSIEEIVEPFLLQQGFIGRTARGRVLTHLAYEHLGLPQPT
jgi:Holliday junction DNA helicase RuvB